MGTKRCCGEWECESLSFDIMLIPNSSVDSEGVCGEKRRGGGGGGGGDGTLPTTSPSKLRVVLFVL